MLVFPTIELCFSRTLIAYLSKFGKYILGPLITKLV